MEDLPLGRITALVPEFAVKHLPLGRTRDDGIFIYTYRMGSKLYSFFLKKCVCCSVHVVLLISLQKITSIRLSYKDVTLFPKIFYVFDVV